MALKSINPTQTEAWAKLTAHFKTIKHTHLRDLFNKDVDRKNNFNLNFSDFSVDYSKNRINQETMDLLIQLANTRHYTLLALFASFIA